MKMTVCYMNQVGTLEGWKSVVLRVYPNVSFRKQGGVMVALHDYKTVFGATVGYYADSYGDIMIPDPMKYVFTGSRFMTRIDSEPVSLEEWKHDVSFIFGSDTQFDLFNGVWYAFASVKWAGGIAPRVRVGRWHHEQLATILVHGDDYD